jgi:hypothetical protein
MTNEIKNHTEQANFRSSVDEILRMSPLTKTELYEVIQECYNESMRLEGEEYDSMVCDRYLPWKQ